MHTQTLILKTTQDFDSASLWQDNFGVLVCGSYHLRVSKRGNINLQYM